MSLSFQKLNVVEVRDPRTILTNVRDYAVLKSGSQTTWKAYTTTSVSQSSIQFSCPPPSGSVIVDRKQYFYLPVRLTFTGIPLVGFPLLRAGRDAPRSYPISSSIDTYQISINNQSVAVNLADVIQALLHYNTDCKLKNLDYSMTPTCPDQSQNYGDLFEAVRSPLGNYADSNDESVMGRGGFAGMVVIQNPVQTILGTVLTAIVDCAFCEPIFLSPFYWGHHNASGFYNVNTMDFNITFLSQAANRMWSHDNSDGNSPISNITAVFGNSALGGPTSFGNNGGNSPLMLFEYITPQESQMGLSPNMNITYPYFDIQRYATDQATSLPVPTPQTFPSNNIQLSSVPRRIYIFARMKNQDLYSSSTNTDTFFQITNVNIQFLNKNGLLSSATSQQLYKMCVKNHCNMSWTQWSGGPAHASVQFPTGTSPIADTTIGTIGSVVCVEFGTDIGLDSLSAPGKLEQCMLSVVVQAVNVSGNIINPTLYVVPILEGTFTISGLGRAHTQIGVISSKDILDAASSPFINYNDVQDVNGGDFLSSLKQFGESILSGLRTAHDFIKNNKILSKGLSFIPHPLGQVGSKVADALGYGDGEGVMVGGKMMSRKSLRDRLR